MTHWPRHARITGPIVMIGFGSIGKGTLPLIERHFEFDPDRFVVIDPDDSDRKLLDERGVRFVHEGLTRDNYRDVLTKYLTAGSGQGFCVNLSVDTSSLDLMRHCRELGALYVDTVVEPWPGFYYDKSLGNDARTNYALRETVLAERRKNPGGSTAVSCCGANPGMVSWFVKQALVNLARDLGDKAPEAKEQRGMGAARPAPRRQGRAYRGARHPAREEPEAAQRVRQHLVDRRFLVGRHAAGRTRLGKHTRNGRRPTRALTRPAAARRSTSISPAPIRGCAHGPRPRAGSSAFSSPTTSPSRSPTITPCATTRARRSTGRPATTPIIRATMRCCLCTNCSAAPARSRARTIFLAKPRFSTASTNWACFSTGTPATPIGTARSCRSRRRAPSRPTRTRPACRSLQRFWPAWSGRSRIRRRESSRRTNWISAAASRFRRPISGPVVGVYTDWTPLAGRPGLFPEEIDQGDPWQFKNVLVR